MQVQADSILRASRGLNLFFYQILLVTLTFDCKVTEIMFLNAKIRKVFSCIGTLFSKKKWRKARCSLL